MNEQEFIIGLVGFSYVPAEWKQQSLETNRVLEKRKKKMENKEYWS